MFLFFIDVMKVCPRLEDSLEWYRSMFQLAHLCEEEDEDDEKKSNLQKMTKYSIEKEIIKPLKK